MSYFETIEKVGQMNIFHYLSIEDLSINETIVFQDVRITRQKRFYEVETNELHEVASTVAEALCLLVM